MKKALIAIALATASIATNANAAVTINFSWHLSNPVEQRLSGHPQWPRADRVHGYWRFTRSRRELDHHVRAAWNGKRLR